MVVVKGLTPGQYVLEIEDKQRARRFRSLRHRIAHVRGATAGGGPPAAWTHASTMLVRCTETTARVARMPA